MKTTAVGLLVSVVLVGASFLVVQEKRTEASSSARADSSAPADVDRAAPAPPETAATPAKLAASADSKVTPSESVAQAAIARAADENRLLFMFVSENDNEETREAKHAFEAAAAKLSDTAQTVFVNRRSAADREVIGKFQLDRAPMPIVLALAPNGAIMGAYFGDKLKAPQLQNSIASASEQQCLKALQDGKLVFLCAQNASTKSNDVAMQGVNAFKADARFAQFTEVVKIDPAASAEQSFLAKLKIDPKMNEATTTLLVPPGVLIAKHTGATSKEELLAVVQAATSGGCGGGGCGPKGCAVPPK